MTPRSAYEASAKYKATMAAYEASERRAEARTRARAIAVDRHAARMAAAKAGGCVDCGSTTRRLHLHHVDPSTKSTNVSMMKGASDDRFAAELAKCVVLCTFCHKARHHVLDRPLRAEKRRRTLFISLGWVA